MQLQQLAIELPLDGSIEDRSPKLRRMMMQTALAGDPTINVFTHDRFGTTEEAIVFDGTRSIVTADDVNMNLKPFTIGLRIHFDRFPTPDRYIIGKTSGLTKEGFYMTLAWTDSGMQRSFDFYIVSDSGRSLIRKNVQDGYVQERRWVWVGLSVDEDGSGYVAVEGMTYKLPDTKGLISNQAKFSIGGLATAGLSNGFEGFMDHVVVYSCYKKFEELKAIMEARE